MESNSGTTNSSLWWRHNVKQKLEILRATIQKALAELHSLSQSAETRELVEIGATLWQTTEEAKEVLEPIKKQLREEGLALLKHQPGTQVLMGIDHRCTVIFPNSKLELGKKTDITRLKTLLGDDFKYIFKEVIKIVPRKELEGRLGDLIPDNQQIVLAAVERQENTARVGFKKEQN